MEMQPLTVYHAAAIICISLMSCEVELLKQNGYWPFSILCSEPDVFQGPLPETTCQLTRKEKYISDKPAFLKGLFFFFFFAPKFCFFFSASPRREYLFIFFL